MDEEEQAGPELRVSEEAPDGFTRGVARFLQSVVHRSTRSGLLVTLSLAPSTDPETR